MTQDQDFFFSEGLAAGDRKVFEVFFNTFYADLCRFALKFVSRPEIAEEIVQLLFIHLWEKREELDVHSAWKPYLYTSVRNRSLNYLKTKYVQTEIHTEVPEEFQPKENATELNMEYRETAEIVRAGIESLPERCRLIFTLSRNSGLTYREIAEELGISPKTVESQMGIALKKLHRFVGKRATGLLLPLAAGLFL